MGYQESFIHTTCSNVERNNEDIKRMLGIFKKYDIRCGGDNLADACAKLHFKKTVSKYKKGMEILVIAGERQAQRSFYNLFNIDSELKDRYDGYYELSDFTKEEREIIKRAKITFIEYERAVLEAESDETKIVVERLNLIPDNLPSNYDKMMGVFEGIRDEFEKELMYEDSPSSDIPSISNKVRLYLRERAQDMEFTVLVKEEIIHTGNKRIDYCFYLDEVQIGHISDLLWNNTYSLWLPSAGDQSFRELCRKLLE